MGGESLVDVATAAGQGVGGGVGLWACLKFIQWTFEFAAKRRDRREDWLTEKEAALEDRFNARLRHVELELERNREALMFLVNAVADKDPANPALREVSRILRGTIPFATPVDSCDDVMATLNQMPGVRS